MFFAFVYIPDWYKTQEMDDSVVSEDPFILVYCPNRYQTQGMCDEAVADCPATLKFISHWCVTSKMLETFHNALLDNDDILFFNQDFNKVTFIANLIHFIAVDLDKINLDEDINFDEDDLDTIIHVRLLAWCSKFEKCQALKKR